MPLATGGGTPLTLNASLQASLKISSGDAPAAAVAGSGTVAQLIGKFECDHILMDRSLLARFMADVTAVDGNLIPGNFATAKDWHPCLSTNGGTAVEINKPVVLARTVYFLKKIMDLSAEIDSFNKASDFGDARAHAIAMFEECQMRLNGCLHMLYVPRTIELLSEISVSKKNSFGILSPMIKLAAFRQYVVEGKIPAENKERLVRDLRVATLECVFGLMTRQRNGDGTCFATAPVIAIQLNDPLWLAEMLIGALGFGKNGDCGIRVLAEGGERSSVETNTNENGKNIKDGDALWSRECVKSLQRLVIRTCADSLADWPSKVLTCAKELAAMEDALKTIGGVNDVTPVVERWGDDVPSPTCTTVKAQCGAAAGNSNGIDEGCGMYAVPFKFNGKDRTATRSTLAEVCESINARLNELKAKVSEDNPNRKEELANFDRAFAALGDLRPYADGTKQAGLYGGYMDIVLKAIYRTRHIAMLNGERDAATAADFFRIIYESIVKYCNENGKLPPAKLVVSGAGHTYTVNAYLLAPYIVSGMDWSAALAKVAEGGLQIVDPNWEHRQFYIVKNGDGDGDARHLEYQPSGTSESGALLVSKVIQWDERYREFLRRGIVIVNPPVRQPDGA
jgi:hypothetical protein